MSIIPFERSYWVISNKLIAGEKLEEKFRDHELKGDLQGERECHIAPDILLKYKYQKDILILLYIDIGSHSDLF